MEQFAEISYSNSCINKYPVISRKKEVTIAATTATQAYEFKHVLRNYVEQRYKNAEDCTNILLPLSIKAKGYGKTDTFS